MAAKTGQLHGRDHSANGVDPVTGFLHFGVNTDSSSLGLEIHLDGSLSIIDGTSSSYAMGNDGTVTVTGATTAVFQSADVQITGLGAGALVTLQAGSLHTVKLSEAAKTTEFKFPTDGKAVFLDHNGDPFCELREDGTIHILTGATIIADL